MTQETARARGSRKLITALFVLLLSAAPAAAGTVTLAWSPNAEEDVAGYIVYWGTASGQYGSTVDVGGNLAFQFAMPDRYARYYFAVAAYNVAGARSELSAEVATEPEIESGSSPLAVTSLTASAASPQIVGRAITFTANATGGVGPLEFKWLLSSGNGWNIWQHWSTSNTLTWRPSSANANYRVGVWVRSAGSLADAPENANAGTSMPFAITSASTPAPAPTPTTGSAPKPPTVGSVSIRSLTANKPSPQPVGTKVSFVASVTGTPGYQSKWWISNGTKWVIAQEWSATSKLTWTPPAAGNYEVLVRVRATANTAQSKGVSIAYKVKGQGK